MNWKKMQKEIRDKTEYIVSTLNTEADIIDRPNPRTRIWMPTEMVSIAASPDHEQVALNEEAGIKNEYPIQYALLVRGLNEKELYELLEKLGVVDKVSKYMGKKKG